LLSAAAGVAVARAAMVVRGGVLSAVIVGPVILSASTSPVDAYATEYTRHTLQKDRRVIADRLDPRQNPGQREYSFLNAVGAVWPHPVQKTGAGFAASTGDDAASGFLIDRCHVLTAMHVVYADDLVVHPALERAVAFAVGQTGSGRDHGALQGLKFLREGIVIAHGDALMLDGMIHNPADDWALILLDGNVDDSIAPLNIGAVDPARLPKGFGVSLAGYPSDHRASRGDGFKFMDLWLSEGTVVDVTLGDWTAALIRTTVQTTPGNSGGPLIGNFDGRHIVIGLAQSLSGNGIDVSDSSPNVQVLFTADTLGRIAAAEAQYPCR